MANQAGLFVDIWAGPLNHKRLILNRLARIWDAFGLGGDNMGLLLDYKMFVEAAKKQALGGNYNILLDTLGASNKPVHQSLLKKVFNAINIGRKDLNYKGLDKTTAITMEYFKDKFEGDDRTMPDEPDTFTIVDETLSRLGKKVKKDIYDNTAFLIKQFINLIKQGESGLEKDYEKEDWEEKELMQ